jgi:hypothetical protein
MEEAAYCFLQSVHLWDEDFSVENEVEDNFPETELKTKLLLCRSCFLAEKVIVPPHATFNPFKC